MCIWRFLLHSSSCFYRNGPYPLEIQFQMRLMDIFEINPTDFSIVVSVYFSFRWTENRLILNTNKSYISLDLEFIKNLWVYEQGAKLYFCCKFGQLLLFSKLSQVAQDTLLTLLGTGGVFNTPPTKNQL